jgi:tetratricopeptide (TPR) repeat protein
VDDYANAKKDFEKCMIMESNNDQVYYYKGLLALETLNSYDAIDAINDAIKYDAGVPDYYALRAKIKIKFSNPVPNSEDYESIMSDINVAIALAPDNHEYFLIRSDFLNSMGDFDAALNDYNTVIKLSPKKEEAYTERGVIKMNNYDYRSAALDFTKSIIINPEDERNYRFRGLCYNNLNNLTDAFKDFTKSIDLLNLELNSTSSIELIKSKLGETYLLRGHCLNLMGNNAQACRDFLFAHNLGIKKGLNYYRKFCGIY